MTDSKSVDNYGFMPAKPFVMNNRTHCLIDGIQFIIYTIAPDLLPFSQTVVRETRNEVTTRKFHACDGQRKSRFNCSISSLITRNVDMTWSVQCSCFTQLITAGELQFSSFIVLKAARM